MGYTLHERLNIMLKRMENYYGPNRIKRMTKEEIDKISILFGVTREERKDSYKLIQEITLDKNVK
jgi:hypothetical protein|tara:strand:+ start:551 stop:745 length:195 start_codon:yes stop_codon:yes gene_type:complete